MEKDMTREDYEIFRDEILKNRFVCVYGSGLLRYLKDRGYRYLFRCTHYSTGRFFWVFDKSQDLIRDVDAYEEEKKGVNPID